MIRSDDVPSLRGRRASPSPLLLALACLALALGGCGSDDDDGDGGRDPDGLAPMPEAFRDVEALFDERAFAAPEHVDLSDLPSDPGDGAFALLGLARGAAPVRIGAMRRLGEGDVPGDRDEYVVHDTESGETTPRLIIPPLFAVDVGRDLSTAAWIEGCMGHVRRLGVDAASVTVGSPVRESTCLRPAEVSADGSTVVFGAAAGRPNAAGELEFAGLDGRLHGPLVHTLGDGATRSLANADIALDDPALQAALPIHRTAAIAADGSVVAVRTSFVPDDFANGGMVDIDVGILLLDTRSGVLELRARHADRRAFCPRCPLPHAEDLVLSGDGRVIWYVRAADADPLSQALPATPARLHRHDVGGGADEAAPIDDVIAAGSLVTSDDGRQVAYLADGAPVLLDLARGTRVRLDRAIRGCTDAACEFASYRLVRSAPLALSGDGRVLTISVIPERDGVDTPQNVEELLVLDIASDTLRRLAPGVDIVRSAASDDGATVVFETSDGGLLPDDDDFDADLFIVRRGSDPGDPARR